MGGAEAAATAFGAARLSPEQSAVVARVRAACLAPATGSVRSPIEQADREDAITAWLEDHGTSLECADALAESAVALESLDELAAAVEGASLDAALRWIAAGCRVRTLTTDIQTATARIHDLVGSVKAFTHMDQARSVEAVDIRRGLADTVTMLGSKTRASNAAIVMQLPDDLPHVRAVGAELNQVWMNLLDNALDAVAGKGGTVRVTASEEAGAVVVRIMDDGPGIPAGVVGRIFDPFFTTKAVGQGTGLGLDIVRRILRRQEAEIEVASRPGQTEFRVILPKA